MNSIRSHFAPWTKLWNIALGYWDDDTVVGWVANHLEIPIASSHELASLIMLCHAIQWLFRLEICTTQHSSARTTGGVRENITTSCHVVLINLKQEVTGSSVESALRKIPRNTYP